MDSHVISHAISHVSDIEHYDIYDNHSQFSQAISEVDADEVISVGDSASFYNGSAYSEGDLEIEYQGNQYGDNGWFDDDMDDF